MSIRSVLIRATAAAAIAVPFTQALAGEGFVSFDDTENLRAGQGRWGERPDRAGDDRAYGRMAPGAPLAQQDRSMTDQPRGVDEAAASRGRGWTRARTAPEADRYDSSIYNNY